MRDPEGKIRFLGNQVKRELYAPLPNNHFLRTPTSKKLVDGGELMPFEILDSQTIASPQIPFVSYPYEWCDAQLYDAAELTLSISEKILSDGWELKDASAWNVIFENGNPRFCDHLSFQKIERPQWWAFAQFVRHFVLPLVISKYRSIISADTFKVSRDGLTPAVAKEILGFRRWLTRYWFLMLNPKDNQTAAEAFKNGAGRSLHAQIFKLTRWLVVGVKQESACKSIWSAYTDTRDHYSSNASAFKYETLEAWLDECSPNWVVDLGCNTGEYSKLAVSQGARVVSIDLDHESIQALYLSSRGLDIFPVLANLDDLAGGRGWEGLEFSSLIKRLEGRADVLLMLALVHHLAISSSIPLSEVAKLAARVSSNYLIVELLSEHDALLMKLASQRARSVEDFTLQKQERAFDLYFEKVKQTKIPNTARTLVLYRRKDPNVPS